MPTLVSARPMPYISPHNNLLHRGVVAVTGTLTVDLGIGHNNFTPSLTMVGGIADMTLAYLPSWAYGTKLGTFVITVAMRDVGFGAWVIATAAANVSFVVVAGASEE